MLNRLGPPLAIGLLAGPVLLGLAGVALPAFGYLPALGGERLSLAPIGELLSEPGLARSAWLSFATGLGSAGLSLGLVILLVAGWSGTRVFARLQAALSPILALPHAAAAFGLAFLIAPSGLIARSISPGITGWTRPPDLLIVNDPAGLALVLGLVVKEAPFLLLMTLAALPQVDATRSRQVASSLGYGRMAGFVFAIWPPIYRQIRLAVFAVIVFSTSVVDMALILGPATPPTLGPRLLNWMNDPDLAMRFKASAGALLQLGISATAILAWIGLERIAAALGRRLAARGRRLPNDGPIRAVALGAGGGAAALVFAGASALGVWSIAGLWPFPDLAPATVTFEGWRTAAQSAGRPLALSLTVGLVASGLALALALLCLAHEDRTGRRPGRAATLMLYLPLLVPQASFLFGLQLLFLLARIDATLPALVLVHLVFVLPYVFLSLSGPWRAFDRRYEAVAAGLGKGGQAVFASVRAPMLLRALLAAFALGFAVSVAQYLPTVLIGAGRLVTIATEAVSLSAGGNRRLIGVYALLQTALPLAAFAIATLAPALLFRRFRAMRV